MCDCIERLEAKVLEHAKEDGGYKKNVESVSLQGKAFSLSDNFKLRVMAKFSVKLEGQKKEPTISVAWSHCAFCGEKIN